MHPFVQRESGRSQISYASLISRNLANLGANAIRLMRVSQAFGWSPGGDMPHLEHQQTNDGGKDWFRY